MATVLLRRQSQGSAAELPESWVFGIETDSYTASLDLFRFVHITPSAGGLLVFNTTESGCSVTQRQNVNDARVRQWMLRVSWSMIRVCFSMEQ